MCIRDRIYDQLFYPLSRIEGVANVTIYGGANPAFWLFVDPDKLAANGLTSEDVVSAIQAQNSVAVGGMVGGPPASGDQAYTYPILIENNGNLISIEDFNNLILNRSNSGNLLKLRDVGEVRYGTNTYNVQAIDKKNHPSLTIGVFQTPTSNALNVADAVVKQMNQFATTVPPGVTVNQIYNLSLIHI